MNTLNKFASHIVTLFQKENIQIQESSSSVNPLVSELATWYEKFRNSIEYRDEEVILRASIERILKRRLALGGNGRTTAKSLLKELVWARYFPDTMFTQDRIEELEKIIDFYLEVKAKSQKKFRLKEGEMRKLMFHLMSSEIEETLHPNKIERAMANYIYYVVKKNIMAPEELEEERDIQTFIAIRRAYAKDDIAFLSYQLYMQYFGGKRLSQNNSEEVIEKLKDAKETIEKQLAHYSRHKMLGYIKRQIPPFLIMEDIFHNAEDVKSLVQNKEELDATILASCQKKYKAISEKVRRAIIRSVIFIALSKVVLAFGIEGTYEYFVYGQIQWVAIAINIIAPIILMIIVGFFLRPPGVKNTYIIKDRIEKLLFDQDPKVGKPIDFPQEQKGKKTILETVFVFLWLAAFFLSFGGVYAILSYLHFSIISQGIFIFFLAIVSFLAYRISITANEYVVERRQGLLSPIIDFFFMPIARVGRYLTESISQVNVFLFILDFAIEAPFKALVGFFDQWFFFLSSKREELG